LLDAFPLVRLFKKEPGFERVKALLSESRQGRAPLLISEINAGELYYAVARKAGVDAAEEIIADLSAIPITLLPTTWDLTLAAARLKAQWSLSYADCFAAACAIQEHAVLVTGDQEFKQVEHLVKIEWV
jgi:ribonuclease VapC